MMLENNEIEARGRAYVEIQTLATLVNSGERDPKVLRRAFRKAVKSMSELFFEIGLLESDQ